MFRSIQWKLVTMFLLVVLAVIILIGTFTINSVAGFYNQDFVNQIETAMTDDFTRKLTAALSEEDPARAIFETAEVFSARLGINSYRSFSVLDYSGEGISGKVSKTENIISAIRGNLGNSVRSGLGFMDYAYPVLNKEGDTEYILYIRDTKEEVYEITRSIFKVILQAMLMGVILSALLGFLLSRTITTPISSLTAKAEKIAQGEFEHIASVSSKDELGQLTNTFGYMTRTLKSTLEEVREERDKVETVISCMTDGVMAFNQKGSLIHINPAAKAMLNIHDPSKTEFDKMFKSLGADITLGHFLYLDRYSMVEQTIEFGGKVLTAFITPYRAKGDKTLGVVVVWQDATKRQRLEGMRREFVANVSHELKTPLTTIKTYTETLIDDNLSDREMGLSFLKTVNGEVDRMTRIVTDLLLLSKIDYSQGELQRNPFSVDKLVRDVVEKIRIDAERRGLTISYEPSSIIPDFNGDKDKMEQVVTNIVSNAVKYTPSGGCINVYAGSVLNEIYIRVKDTGIGIPKEDLKHVFERFYRVDKARSRESGGTGLGLSIAKEIVEAHGGTISIDSNVGEGTTVLMRFPNI